MNSSFQQQLKQLTFKTFYHDQMATFGYDDLFANRRVIVFSMPQFFTKCAGLHLGTFRDCYTDLVNNGVDDICAVDSTNWLIGPYIDNKKHLKMKGLPDRDMKFVQLLAEAGDYQKPVKELARLWQYTALINNGELEQLWHNPFESDDPLTLLKDPSYRFQNLSADVVVKYLVDKQA